MRPFRISAADAILRLHTRKDKPAAVSVGSEVRAGLGYEITTFT